MHTFATVQTAIGYVVLTVVFLAVIAYGLANIRSGHAEIGSEVFTAPNRKPYYDDAILETKRLDRALYMAFGLLAIISVVLPLYWLREPGRQENATRGHDNAFRHEGEMLFGNNTPTNHDGLGCAGCHGEKGVGGIAAYTVTDSSGRFLKQVTWKAPALDTVTLRYSRSDVRYIIQYGRPFSPMAAWGVDGGGPLDDQAIEDLVTYMESIQLSPKAAQKQVKEGLKKEKAAAIEAGDPYPSDGAALFNLGYYADVAGGAYSCGRCHTQGWSYGDKGVEGGGAFGPNLLNIEGQFPGSTSGTQDMIDFVCQGSANGTTYGIHGMGTGRMPAFCQTKPYNPNTDRGASQPNVEKQDLGDPGSGMMTRQDVADIVNYVRGL